jgi:hypothetical protein
VLIDTRTLDVQFFPFTFNFEKIDRFKIIDSTILLVQSLEHGDLVQLYDYRSGFQISLAELSYPKTRIWDVQVKDGIFDILLYQKGDLTYQSLKMVGFNTSGSKLYETEILPQDLINWFSKLQNCSNPRKQGIGLWEPIPKNKGNSSQDIIMLKSMTFWSKS